MIQKLRKQFILVAMCSTMAVLVIIIGALNVVNYLSILHQKDEILTILSSNNGRFPMMDEQKKMPRSENPPEPPNGDFSWMDFTMWVNKEGGGPKGRGRFSREMEYETRFFSVTLDENGTVTGQDLGMIAAIEEDRAVTYANAILKHYLKNGRAEGFLDEYRYHVEKMDSSYLILFVDSSSDLQEFRKTLLYSIATSLVGLLAVFGLVVFFSKRVFRPVAESYEKQKQFITDASHELKTPLTIISANVEVMEMESEESNWSRSIKKQIDRMVNLVEQMVTLSRLDEQKEIEKEDFSISDAVKDVAQPYYPVAESSGMDLTLEIEDGVNFHGNEKQIRQMVGLLLDNCMKYAAVPEGESEGKPKILVSLKSKGKKVELKVWNTVSSMEAGDQSILFERFYRPDSSRNSAKGGSGIGLSIVKSIVESHKGQITAKSKDGKSIEFKAIF